MNKFIEQFKTEYATAENKLHISKGNKKIGSADNVSLPPVVTCPSGVPCATCGKCYALKSWRQYSNVRKAWTDNLKAFTTDTDGYFKNIAQGVKGPAFRWHVSGDIVNAEYFQGVVNVAQARPEIKFLIFTKKYSIVNDYLNNNGAIPENLAVIFSVWNAEIENPHELPTASVIFKGQEFTPGTNDFICPGNCENCRCAGVGCWMATKGQKIYFNEH